MAYTDTPFVPTNFIDVPDPENPPIGYVEADAGELNKLGQGIRDTRDTVLQAIIKLDLNEYNGFNPVNEFPAASESYMTVTNAGWPTAGGIVKTVRHRASVLSDAEASFDYQMFKDAGSEEIYIRTAKIAPPEAWIWDSGATYNTQDFVRPTVDNGFYYRASQGGTAHATTEPTWITASTANITDNTVIWNRYDTFWSDWKKFTLNLVPLSSATQAIDAATDTIIANAETITVSNGTAGPITLTSTPHIEDGFDRQQIEIINISANNIILQDSGTLTGSNLRLGATTRTLGARDIIKLRYYSTIDTWIETGFNTVL